MHYQAVKRKLPEPNIEVIGFNREWITNYNPDGTRPCIWHDLHDGGSNCWIVVDCDKWFKYKSIIVTIPKNEPTHWCSKPIPPITLK